MRFLTAISIMLAAGGPALAQNALSAGQPNAPTRPNPLASPIPGYTVGVTGRALDANLQVGSGGFNAPVANFSQELALRNAVVTGNVAGGRAFRGDVGYAAADDFRGQTGSDDLFEFQRDSSYSGLATQGLRGITPLQFQLTESTAGQTKGILGDLIVRRDSTAYSADDATGASPSGALTVDPFGNLRGSLRSTSDFLLRNARSPKIIGSIGSEDEGARRLHIAVNPLIGVKALNLSNSVFAVPERPDLMFPDQGPRATKRTDAEATEGRRPGVADPVGQMYKPPSTYDALRADLALRADTFISRRFGEEPPSPEGEAAAPPKPAVPTENMQQRFDRMMEEFRQSFRDRLQREQAPTPTEEPSSLTPGEPKAPAPEEDPNKPPKPALTPEELVEHAKGLFENGEVRLQAFLDAQGADDLYSWHMNKGQESLRAERWFDAEERFTAAIRARPGDPMAAAARVHAQIGASMFMSAGVNLRNLFAAYPELIPTRYPDDLFPRGRRLDGIRTILRDRIKMDSPFAREAALILAYVGWQTGSQQDLADGFGALDRFHAEAGDKPSAMELVLREVWATP